MQSYSTTTSNMVVKLKQKDMKGVGNICLYQTLLRSMVPQGWMILFSLKHNLQHQWCTFSHSISHKSTAHRNWVLFQSHNLRTRNSVAHHSIHKIFSWKDRDAVISNKDKGCWTSTRLSTLMHKYIEIQTEMFHIFTQIHHSNRTQKVHFSHSV